MEMFNGVSEHADFVCDASSALELKFVRTPDDFENDELVFRPAFTHQVFGENENIFGYKNLRIKLYYTSDHLDTYIGISYTGKVDPSTHDGLKPDNIFTTLLEYIPDGYITNVDEYTSLISKDRSFSPYGNLLHVYTTDDAKYEIYLVDLSFHGFKEYHERLQTFVLWFIDAGSFIDTEDDKWSFYLMYEKSEDSGKACYSIVGYSTVYNYYAYPDKIRPRISQMLIFPPYQRRGLGSQLLQAIYNDLVPNSAIADITVEDPSPEFVAMRDAIDCRNALRLPYFQSPQIFDPFSEDVATLCRNKLKIHKKQARRVYEILRLKATDRSNVEQYRQYRLAVKNRLNGPYKKQQQDLEKLKEQCKVDDVMAVNTLPSREDRLRWLNEEYQRLETEYMAVIDKLASMT